MWMLKWLLVTNLHPGATLMTLEMPDDGWLLDRFQKGAWKINQWDHDQMFRLQHVLPNLFLRIEHYAEKGFSASVWFLY